MCFCNVLENVAGDPARSKWKPGNENNAIAVTIFHYVIPLTIGQAVAILNRHDGNDFARSFDVLLSHVGKRDTPDLSLVSQLSQGLHRGIERHHRIGSMQLVYIDAIETQPLQTSLHCLAQV